jgi:hypothetical protein
VAAYGSTASRSWSEGSDIDLFAIIDAHVPVESLHFFNDGIPVDINLRNREQWSAGPRHWVPPDGLSPLWDPDGLFDLAAEMPAAARPDGQEMSRFGHRHVLFKLRRWLKDDPELADLVVAGETYWVLHAYFLARGMPYPGPEPAVTYAREHDPGLVEKLHAALTPGEDRLRLLEEAAELALAPVGGVWKEGEVIAFGWEGSPSADEVEQAKRLLGPVIAQRS